MLFKPEDLSYGYDPIQEAADILNESVYLDESESILSPMAVPVVENARIGACVVAFDDVERLAEDHGVDYIDAMVGIAEANGIDMDHLAVSVPEWKIIADPEVVNELSNVIVSPISSQNPIYQFCEACVGLALQEEDESYIEDAFVDTIVEATHRFGNRPLKKLDTSNLTSIKRTAVNSGKSDSNELDDEVKSQEMLKKGTLAKLLQTVKKYGYTTPKKKIAEALTALKRQYNKFYTWTQETDKHGNRPFYKKILGAIAKAINKLTNFLANAKDMASGMANTHNDIIKDKDSEL